MDAVRDCELIRCGKEIARSGEIASSVGPTIRDLRCSVECGAPTDNDCANRPACMNPARQVYRRAAIEIECAARKAEGGAIEKRGRKDVRFAEADDLFAKENIDKAKGIAGWGMGFAIVGRVNGGERVFLREDLIESRCAEIFADSLQWIAVSESDSACGTGRSEQFWTIGDRPQGEKRPNAGDSARAGIVVGHEGNVTEAEILAVAFVVGEKEAFVFFDRAA